MRDIAPDLGRHVSTVTVRQHFTGAQILCDLGHFDEARASLAFVHSYARNANNPLALHHAYLVEAQIALDEMNEPAAVTALQCAFSSNCATELNFIYSWRRPRLARLLGFALEHEIAPESVRRIIAERDLNPLDDGRHLESWPWPLRIYSYGRLKVLRHGEPLTFPRKLPRKPLDLLKALVVRGGDDVPVALLVDELWPELDGDAAHRAFETTLHRLRRLLDVPDVIDLTDGRLSLDRRIVWDDRSAVRALADRVEIARKQGGNTDRAHLRRLLRRLRALSAVALEPGTEDDSLARRVRMLLTEA